MTTMIALLESLAIDATNLVDTCINGQEAIDKITESYNNDIKYSLIFMDFSMPVMNGIDGTKGIREFLSINKRIQRKL